MAGCAATCEQYGVLEHDNAKDIRKAQALTQQQLNYICKGIYPAGYHISGCIIPVSPNSVDIYWARGDDCAEQHERCHARHGLKHTQRYNRDVLNGHPRPACP